MSSHNLGSSNLEYEVSFEDNSSRAWHSKNKYQISSAPPQLSFNEFSEHNVSFSQGLNGSVVAVTITIVFEYKKVD